MTSPRHVKVGGLTLGNDLPLVLIAGPCQIESRDHALFTAEKIFEAANTFGIGLIYKSSFDKANRTSVGGIRGLGMGPGLDVLAAVRERIGCPVTTDVHEAAQCMTVAAAVDLLQIPAFLCRQTDLLLAAGETGKPINVKKGQFLAPWDMKHVVDKIGSTGNHKVLLCDRGTSFGYNTLVSDFRSLPIMAQTGCPVIFDASHSTQQPGGKGDSAGGQREFISPLARAAVAVGVSAVFLETHEDPNNAPSDGDSMLPLAQLEGLLRQLQRIQDALS